MSLGKPLFPTTGAETLVQTPIHLSLIKQVTHQPVYCGPDRTRHTERTGATFSVRCLWATPPPPAPRKGQTAREGGSGRRSAGGGLSGLVVLTSSSLPSDGGDNRPVPITSLL